MSDKEQPKQELRKLLGGKLKRAEFERTVYRICPEYGTTLEDLLKPEYWSHVGKQLRHFDKIEVVFEDSSRYLELVVIDCAPLWAKVSVVLDLDLTDEKEEANKVRQDKDTNGDFRVEWGGNNQKFRVIRVADKEKIKEGFATKAEAEKWVEEHRKTVAV